ncbi:MAG: restriction endonuclease [Anaerolineae bacterium]|nr:restriction endonuclease [Anaerolineae bacterium]
MANTGKLLEGFVAQIEKALLPNKFTITTNDKLFTEGTPVAEFDIVIAGKIGSTNFKWLIECRDRPSQGPVPGEWIEQLFGRRDRFKFDKIIAVSTTGFSDGAAKYAKDKGIETREIKEADLSQISDWFKVQEMVLTKSNAMLESVEINIDDTDEKIQALSELLLSLRNPDEKILFSTETKDFCNLATAFLLASQSAGLFTDIDPKGGSKRVKLQAQYTNDKSCFLIKTKLGDVRIKDILFGGVLKIILEKIPICDIKKYESTQTGNVIATETSFKFDVGDNQHDVSFIRIEDTGQTIVGVGTTKRTDSS